MITKQARQKVNRRWKAAEDWWGKQTGWKREGHLRRGTSCADLVSELFSLDVTTVKKLPGKVEKEMLDAEYHAANSPMRTPIIAIHAVGQDMKQGLVIMRVSEFLNLHIGEPSK